MLVYVWFCNCFSGLVKVTINQKNYANFLKNWFFKKTTKITIFLNHKSYKEIYCILFREPRSLVVKDTSLWSLGPRFESGRGYVSSFVQIKSFYLEATKISKG